MAENFKNRIETINSELSNPSSKFSKEDLERISKELENLYTCINELFLKLADDIKKICSAFENFKIDTLLKLENNIPLNGEITEDCYTDIISNFTIHRMMCDGKIYKVVKIHDDGLTTDITEEYIKEYEKE